MNDSSVRWWWWGGGGGGGGGGGDEVPISGTVTDANQWLMTIL